MRTAMTAVAAGAAMLLGGCGTSDGNVATVVESDNAMVAPAATLDPGNASVGDNVSATAQAAPLLNVSPDGVSLVDRASGSARHIAFGTPADVAVRAATAALGAKRAERDMAECGAGAMTLVRFPGDLTLNLMDGSFVGWSLDGGGESTIGTAAGIHLGSTRAELEKAYRLEMIEETSLGNEFYTGSMSGILTSMAPSGTIENLWAGTSCVFR